MKILLNQPLAINHIGGRENNEDSIFPPLGMASVQDKLFLVCDGVGGNEKGEVASKLACDKFAEYFATQIKGSSDASSIDKALKYTEDAFDKYIANNESAKGMGTTLTLLHFHDEGATVAHIGDSRVYQFRNGEIIFQTSDHSMVNELLKANIITEEQAKDDPRKNVISRAIQGASVKKTSADVAMITDIQEGDYFFLCSDGILENIGDFEIGKILAQTKGNDEKIKQIQERCELAPNDNFSAYLIQLGEVEGAIAIAETEDEFVEAEIDEPDEVVIAEAEVDEELAEEVIIEKPKSPSPLKKLFPFFLIIIAVIILGIWMMGGDDDKKADNDQKAEKIESQDVIGTEITKNKLDTINKQEAIDSEEGEGDEDEKGDPKKEPEVPKEAGQEAENENANK